jgi:aspartyl aminopeptidase
MHSATETAAVSDLYEMLAALDAFYRASISVKGRFIKLDV